MTSRNVVILGTGEAGVQAALSLRDEGFEGRILLVGDEPDLPYRRPPLSKAYLTGAADERSILLRSESVFAARRLELLLGRRATAIDRAARQVLLADGSRLDYDDLVLALGSRNRRLPLPGAELEGVLGLRTRGEALALRARLQEAQAVAVIGAGFIGLEIAAAATALGRRVTVLDMAMRPMSRAVSAPVADFFTQAHRQAGVDFRFGARIEALEGSDGRVAAVRLAGGERVPADLVVVGIGIVPNCELAAEAGLPVANGITVDAQLLTADPAISAIGDCAAFPSPLAPAPIRLESVQNAVDQARCVAARLAGKPLAYAALPWFWSDQGKLKLQIVGLATGGEEIVWRGDPASGQFSAFCYRGERLVAVESVNRPADHVAGRRILGAGSVLTPAQAADPAFELKRAFA